MADARPKGLISFLYHALKDDEVKAEFRDDKSTTMQGFDLSEEVMNLVISGGELSGDQRKDKAEQIAQKMIPELIAEYNRFW